MALLVGVDEYTSRKLEKLRYAERDVTVLAPILTTAGFQVRVLLGSAKGRDEATRANVEAALAETLRGVGKTDTVLLAFSGHGVQLITKEKGPGGRAVEKEEPFFCPRDAVPSDPATLVSINAVLKVLDQKGGGHNLILVDACRNVVDPNRGGRGGINGGRIDNLPEGTAVFFSCSGRQRAMETDKAGGGHGLFFHFVLEGLRGAPGATDGEGRVTWDRLVPYVKEKVKKAGPEWLPDLPAEERQIPFAIGSLGDVPPLVDAGGKEGEPAAGSERKFAIADGVEMVFCWVPSGTAQLGSTQKEQAAVAEVLKSNKVPGWLAAEAEGKGGKFTTAGFWLGKYEVAQAEWEAVLGRGENRSEFRPGGNSAGKVTKLTAAELARLPVENASWNDCQKFLAVVNKRPGAGKFALPREDEWEYAARAGKGNGLAFYWGNALGGTQANCDGNLPFGAERAGRSLGRTCPVDNTGGGKYEPHPWGVLHLHGNVAEWCEDAAGDGWRVHRGGAWRLPAHTCRAACRGSGPPDAPDDSVGFRVLLRPE